MPKAFVFFLYPVHSQCAEWERMGEKKQVFKPLLFCWTCLLVLCLMTHLWLLRLVVVDCVYLYWTKFISMQLRARRDKRAQDIAHIHGVCSWQHDCPELDSWVSYAVVLFSFAVSNWQWKAANVRWPASGLSWVTLCVELFSHRIQWRRIPLNPKAI